MRLDTREIRQIGAGIKHMSSKNSPSNSDMRNRTVETQLIEHGITDKDVLRAMRSVPREKFVSPGYAQFAYEDRPLPIGSG